MTQFVASIRRGGVLHSDCALSWLNSIKAIELLYARVDTIDAHLVRLCGEFFNPDEGLGVASNDNVEAGPSDPIRGQFFHSDRVCFQKDGLDICVALSFTVCVELRDESRDRAFRTPQSKFWCSAIVGGDARNGNPGEDEAFVSVHAAMDGLVPALLEACLPVYEDALIEVEPRISAIYPTGDMFSIAVFQVDDERFHDDLLEIQMQRKTLSQMSGDTALGLLNKVYSGPSAEHFLHAGRENHGGDAEHATIETEAILHSDGLRACVFLIETKNLANREADLRLLGVTSSAEPVRIPRAELVENNPVHALVHTPASLLSAQLALEIGEQF